MYWGHDLPPQWQERTGNIISGYRFLAFGIAASQISIFTQAGYSLIPPALLVAAIGIYTLFKVLHPIRWYQGGIVSFSLLGADIIVCVFLVTSTGGIYSPYLLYTLVPVLTAALFLDTRVTLTVAGLSTAYVVASHIGNLFFAIRLSPSDLGYLFVYIIAVCLSAVLPYLINVNLRQQLESENIHRERQMLSHEIHDGTAQTLSALGWQVQLLNRRLAEMGIELNEAKQLEELAEKAQQKTLESMELLRSATSGASFPARLKEYLKEFSQDINIDFRVDAKSEDIHLQTQVELELLRICQEAVTNIRKHSSARSTKIQLGLVDNRLQVRIADDGCGFDTAVYYRDVVKVKSGGLAVMPERAESIGGRFQVSSVLGQGTEVQVEVPFARR
ncbi:sensor histidine kinase [Chloroflexota bacterium]